MDTDEIIQRLRLMNPKQLEKVKRFLDRLQGLPDNQKDGQGPADEDAEPGQ